MSVNIHPDEVESAAGRLAANDGTLDPSSCLDAAQSAMAAMPGSEAAQAFSDAYEGISEAFRRYQTASDQIAEKLIASARTYERTEHETAAGFRGIAC